MTVKLPDSWFLELSPRGLPRHTPLKRGSQTAGLDLYLAVCWHSALLAVKVGTPTHMAPQIEERALEQGLCSHITQSSRMGMQWSLWSQSKENRFCFCWWELGRGPGTERDEEDIRRKTKWLTHFRDLRQLAGGLSNQKSNGSKETDTTTYVIE